MPLDLYLEDLVPWNSRERGEGLYSSGKVYIVSGGARRVHAIVRGKSSPVVSLSRDRKTLKVACSCPDYQRTKEVCEHIWAAILEAEEQGFLQQDGDPDYIAHDASVDLVGTGAPVRSGQPNVIPLRPTPPRTLPDPAWKKSLLNLRSELERRPALQPVEPWPADHEIVYIVDLNQAVAAGLVVEVAQRFPKKDGTPSLPRAHRVPLAQVPTLPVALDRQILSFLNGASGQSTYGYGYNPYYESTTRYQLSSALIDTLFPLMCGTGRCLLRRPDEPDLTVLRWDEGAPWEFWLVARAEGDKSYRLLGELRRGEERVALADPVILMACGLVFWPDRVARLNYGDAFEWILLLRKQGHLKVPVADRDALLKELFALPRLPKLDFPEEMRVEEVSQPPRPRLLVKAPEQGGYHYGKPRLRGYLSFDYDGEIVNYGAPGGHVFVPERRRLLRRSPEAEQAAHQRLTELKFKLAYGYGPNRDLELAQQNLPKVVRTLLTEGWHVEAEGKLYRQPGKFDIKVSSGVDWFELHAQVDFDGASASLPELLAALKRGDNCVQLGDGTFGLLPEEWLRKYGKLANLGESDGDHVRFRRTQAGLLDALLAAQPEATCDAVFAHVREELRSFAGVQTSEPPPGFVGTLRAYQRDGLGWLLFLQRFGFGGCLADDMGLGKTVQVLALLETRRALRASAERDRPGPSLVVVPRSVVFNWKQEAARFTPQLRVMDHTGPVRAKDINAFDDVDVVLTTYGTLRRDIKWLKDVEFDYAILDEAQAVKNSTSESSKATRLLNARHRLAMSGTPIENHLGELWSLFEFLNPGMLGSASVFQLAAGRQPDEETRTLLARAVRPFILRRTKEQVASDLPAKTEQTLYCELDVAQRRRYDELREHYRRSILQKVEQEGMERSTMSILEALLRLRQAACHPGLIDPKKVGEPSAKLEALLPQLEELLQEGHKVLVFSQFVSLLSIVRSRLDKAEITYEYLDGSTRDRQERVERFQSDPDCKLFLISLRAGGLGLNLTAASYVFLLDPWWNPAVEAQAIDRAHRIGQEKPVFAYRLIARNTVEEKILELQRGKRELADAIINADNSLIRNLTRDDLELLLS